MKDDILRAMTEASVPPATARDVIAEAVRKGSAGDERSFVDRIKAAAEARRVDLPRMAIDKLEKMAAAEAPRERAHNADGTFKADDPATGKNEAFKAAGGKKKTKGVVAKAVGAVKKAVAKKR